MREKFFFASFAPHSFNVSRQNIGMIEIRRATTADVPDILPLVEEYWRFEGISNFEPTEVEKQLICFLNNSQVGAGWISTSNKIAVGYLIAVYVFSLEHLGITAEIDEFFVIPSERSQGVGAELLSVAESEFRKVGCTNVSLQLARYNNIARTFYHSHKYVERTGYELLEKTLHNG